MARLTPKDAAGLMDAYRKVHTPPPEVEPPAAPPAEPPVDNPPAPVADKDS